MRLGIDIRPIMAAGLGRGLGIYTANLVKNLLIVNQEHHFSLFAARNQKIEEFLPQIPSTQHVTVAKLKRPTRNIFLWDQVLWWALLKKERVEVFHSTVYGVPLVCPCKRVFTIHDLTPLIFPEFFKKFHHQAVYRFNFFTGKYADRIITSSQNSKQDIMHYLNIPDNKISVIYDGVGAQYRRLQSLEAIENIRTRYQIPGKFLLYVGGFDANKNLPMLVEAFKQLIQQKHLPDKNLFLVFVGNLTPATEPLREYVRARGIEEHVIFTGFVPEEDLIGLYNAAEVFVFPSIYEGFGLPPLEAMACGIPVIASKASSLPEVVGDAAIQVNPHSPEELSQRMFEILTNDKLRQELSHKGLERAKLFSWEQTARKTLQVYEEVLNTSLVRRIPGV